MNSKEAAQKLEEEEIIRQTALATHVQFHTTLGHF